MVNELKRFIQDESGPELIEWAVVTVILLLATILILGAIRTELGKIYNEILSRLKNDVLTEPIPPSS